MWEVFWPGEFSTLKVVKRRGGADDGWTIVSGFSIPLFPNLFVVAVETSQISNFSSAFLQSLAKKKVEDICST